MCVTRYLIFEKMAYVQPVVSFDGMEANFIDADIMRLTVKLVPTERSNVSYGEVLHVICDAGLQPEEILGVYKVSPSEPGYSLYLKTKESVDFLLKKGKIGSQGATFSVMGMSEQIVSIRIHWLPIYYMDAIIERILAPYGEILGIKGMKTSHARLSALNGTREVLLRTDEIHKQRIPHLIKFNSGQSVLITMAGRQPLCLKCHEVGHVRRDCPTNRSFSGLFSRQVEVTGSRGRSAGVASAGPTAGVEPVSSDTVAVPEPSAEGAVGTADVRPASGVSGARDSDEEMSEERRGKRARDEGDDDFISPNRTAKVRSLEPEPTLCSNPFEAIMENAGELDASNPGFDLDAAAAPPLLD